MAEINFAQIVPRGGSQNSAFEELCCQLASKSLPAKAKFERFRGDGGDGGVECIAQLNNGSKIGWQAKYVFDIDALINQVDKSLRTALSVHKELTKYIICFPFDLTGKTKRKGKSESEKFKIWADNAAADAKKNNQNVIIEIWSAHKIQSLLVEKDVSGGIRFYFFTAVTLTDDWFSQHLSVAAKVAGPRYAPQLNVQTQLWTWFSSFEGGLEWRGRLESQLAKCHNAIESLRRHVDNSKPDAFSPPWPANALQLGKDAVSQCDTLLAKAQLSLMAPDDDGFQELLVIAEAAQRALGKIDAPLIHDLETKHGRGMANSQPFRHFQAEYQSSFPAANLDAAREATKEVNIFFKWLSSPTGFLAFKKTFVLAGAGGVGKTHGICDMAFKRLERGGYTCVAFGHQFNGQPDFWTRVIESLGLPTSLGKNGLLDALNAAGQISGKPLLFCIDAINETRPRDYWLQRYLPIEHEFNRRSHLKLCLSCRTSFLPVCLPTNLSDSVIEHKGFSGVERQACNAFFNHYDLEPPLMPILLPELSNPLYLKLVCETLKLKGLRQLPTGWGGLAPVIRAFLAEKEKQFALEHSISTGAGIVTGSLSAIASVIASSGEGSIAWSQAENAIITKRPQAASYPIIEWLVRADLLIEDGPSSTDLLGSESILRPAFERFGDFLIAAELLVQIKPGNLEKEFADGGNLAHLCVNTESLNANAGVLLALSVLVPEKREGAELPELVSRAEVRSGLLVLTVQALPWRLPDTFSRATNRIVREALANPQQLETTDALLSIATQPSVIDAHWVSSLLRTLSLAKRDAFWCSYLNDRFEQEGIVKRLIDATKDIELSRLADGTAERWGLVLMWFTAAADRRVKDHATRSAIALFKSKPNIILPLIEHFLTIDDDELRERMLLCAYGSLIVSPNRDVLKATAEGLLSAYRKNPADFQNAIIRDHIRCLAELANHLGVLGSHFDPLLPSTKIKSRWSRKTPSEKQVGKWRESSPGLRLLARSCLDDDFNHYSIGCLSPWHDAMNNDAIGEWILDRVIRAFGYEESQCDKYDEHITFKSGGGRSKPVWAERIGKKYQWLALYQLASRLYDNVKPNEDSFDPKPLREPLILQEERKLDPTLSQTTSIERSTSEYWWIQSGVSFAATERLDDIAWVKFQDDLPSLQSLLNPIHNGGQHWIILKSYLNWSDRSKDAKHNTPYRYLSSHLQSYLVPRAMFAKACAALEGRNLFGDWMPKGAKWLHCFAGEYPWATACNTEPDWWLGWRDSVRRSRGSPLKFLPTSNELVAEWEYDASLLKSIYFSVPAREFFNAEGLWWNGKDGFCTPKNITVFRDPHAIEGGPSTLIADCDDLIQRIDQLGYRLLWTFIGEKMVVSDARKVPTITYSQVAFLEKDGSVKVGKPIFFEDRNQDQGLNTGTLAVG